MRALAKLARAGGAAHALMFLDLDQFKVINDTCGHQAGDELLRQLSRRLRSTLRSGDLLARLGGDEFGVLLPACSVDHALAVANKLIAETGEFTFSWKDRRFGVGVSIGLVEVNAQSSNVAELMSAADMACHAAKEGGRNRVRTFRNNDEELAQRRAQLNMTERVTTALSSGRMALAVQTARALESAPQVQAYQELLLRVFDLDGELIPTAAVIAAAERLNLMSSHIHRWVLQTACRHIASGHLKADEHHVVAVNISAQSLCDEIFLNFALETLRSSGIDPRWLCIEITETAAIANPTWCEALETSCETCDSRLSTVPALRSRASTCGAGLDDLRPVLLLDPELDLPESPLPARRPDRSHHQHARVVEHDGDLGPARRRRRERRVLLQRPAGDR